MRRSWVTILLLLVSCSRPKPPTLTPSSAVITSISAAGIGMLVQLAAENPNSTDLSARSVSAKVVLDGAVDMGSVTIAKPVTLTAHQTSQLSVPLSIGFRDLPAVMALALANRPIPYEVSGKVNLGGDLVNVDLPFTLKGVISHDQLLQATVNSLPMLPLK